MRKKNKGVLILIIVLVLLLAVYFGLRSWNVSQEEKEEAEQEAATVHVTDTAAEDIVSLKFNVGNGDLEFSKEDDKWYYTPDKDFPLQQSYPEDMAEAAGSITADRELTDGDSLDAYGLDDPAYTVEYTDAEGNVTELLFGDMTGDDYYVMISGSDTVYTVSSSVIDALNYSLEDMAQLDDYPSIGSGNLVKEGIIGKEYTLYYNDAVYKPDRTGLTGYNYIYSGYSEAKENEPPVSAEDGRTLKISGILRLKDGLTYGCLSDGLCITESLLTEYIAQNMQSDIVKTLNEATDSTIINKLVGEVTFEDIFQGQIMPQAKYSSTSTTMPELIRLLGGNDTPSGISVYAKDFNTKEDMLSYMDAWNSAVEKARSAYYEENGTYDGYDGPTEVS